MAGIRKCGLHSLGRAWAALRSALKGLFSRTSAELPPPEQGRLQGPLPRGLLLAGRELPFEITVMIFDVYFCCDEMTEFAVVSKGICAAVYEGLSRCHGVRTDGYLEPSESALRHWRRLKILISNLPDPRGRIPPLILANARHLEYLDHEHWPSQPEAMLSAILACPKLETLRVPLRLNSKQTRRLVKSCPRLKDLKVAAFDLAVLLTSGLPLRDFDSAGAPLPPAHIPSLLSHSSTLEKVHLCNLEAHSLDNFMELFDGFHAMPRLRELHLSLQPIESALGAPAVPAPAAEGGEAAGAVGAEEAAAEAEVEDEGEEDIAAGEEGEDAQPNQVEAAAAGGDAEPEAEAAAEGLPEEEEEGEWSPEIRLTVPQQVRSLHLEDALRSFLRGYTFEGPHVQELQVFGSLGYPLLPLINGFPNLEQLWIREQIPRATTVSVERYFLEGGRAWQGLRTLVVHRPGRAFLGRVISKFLPSLRELLLRLSFRVAVSHTRAILQLLPNLELLQLGVTNNPFMYDEDEPGLLEQRQPAALAEAERPDAKEDDATAAAFSHTSTALVDHRSLRTLTFYDQRTEGCTAWLDRGESWSMAALFSSLWLPGLQQLRFEAQTQAGPMDVAAFVQRCPALEILSVKHCPHATLRRPQPPFPRPQLEWVNILNCPLISADDIAAWS